MKETYGEMEVDEQGLKPSMSMLVCGPEMVPRTYQSWYRDWLRFATDAGFGPPLSVRLVKIPLNDRSKRGGGGIINC